jgi:GGDEF domain-containing protein
VTSARDLFEAIARAVQDPPHLVVLSLEGLAPSDRRAVGAFRHASPDVRILLLAPSDRWSEVGAFLRAGADAVLPAPLDPDLLLPVATSLLRPDGTDVLTGLPNRAAGEAALERELALARRYDKSVAFVLFDLDGFGRLNEKFGYATADGVLASFAACVRPLFRTTDVLYRWGGDEFVVLLTNLPPSTPPTTTTKPEATATPAASPGALEARRRAHVKLDQLRDAVRVEPLRPGKDGEGRREGLTMKVGISFYPWDGATGPELFAVANRRLQRAQQLGGDRTISGEESPDWTPGA